MLVLALTLTIFSFSAMAQNEELPPDMDRYVVGLVTRGPSWTAGETPERAKLIAGHLAHIGKMAQTGKLVAAGPLLDGGEVIGLFIFHGISADEAKALAAEDPAMKAGHHALELHPWLGTKGIGTRYAEMAKATPVEQMPMVTLQFAFLRRGASWTPDRTPEVEKIQEGHMAHIHKMADAGKLIVAGPFADGGQLRGIFIFKATAEEARALASEDPAVKAGRLALDVHPWMVADGIMP
jgi:uncharacterized protein YciI